MPDGRLQRTRATLPSGYQFGERRTIRVALPFVARCLDDEIVERDRAVEMRRMADQALDALDIDRLLQRTGNENAEERLVARFTAEETKQMPLGPVDIAQRTGDETV